MQRRLGLLVGLACPLLAVGGASGSAMARGLSAQALAGARGVRAEAPSPAALAQALALTTGLSPSQVEPEAVCPPATPGNVSCAAQALVARSTGLPVRPRAGTRRVLRPLVVALGARRGESRLVVALDARRGESRLMGPAADVPSAQAPPLPGTPAYLQQAYDLSYLSQTGGTGDVVAVIDAYDDPTAESDLAVYRSTYGLPECTSANGCFDKVNELGQSSPLPRANAGWSQEISLDLDAVSSLCPNCQIILIEAAASSWNHLNNAVSEGYDLHANQVSLSFSGPNPPTVPYTFSGVATVAATGDDGYLGPSQDSYPAALPGVTAVGGTALAGATDGQGGRGFTESAWENAGSGCDLQEPKPTFQTDSGCSGRAYADLSADADPSTGIAVYDTSAGSSGNGWMVYGGTSLATPLTAAYYAITGVDDATPAWAYGSSSLLNDPVTGSNGSCDPSIAYICTAEPGYDGPTGVGSISGAVVPGAPGIGGPTVDAGDGTATYSTAVDPESAALVAGVYPNGFDTTYWWEYGPTTSYGQTTAPTDVGEGSAPVPISATLAGLSAGTTYHYRLVAQNQAGTTYGYDYTLSTPAAGSDTGGQGTTPPSGPTGPGQGSSPPPTGTPQRTVHAALRIIRAPTLSAAAAPLVGSRVRVTGGSYSGATAVGVQFWRCTPRCSAISRPSAASAYTLGSADAGAFIFARVTVSGPGGSTAVWATGMAGPVTAPRATFAALRQGVSSSLRLSHGARLAVAAEKLSRRHGTLTATITVTRNRAVGGSILAWACAVGTTQLGPCTPVRALQSAPLSLTVHPLASERVELIALTR